MRARRGFNKVTLIGNFGKDFEVQVLEGNVPMAKFSVATTETWRGLAQAYLCKGSLVYVEGKFKNRHYDDPAGVRHYVTEIVGEASPTVTVACNK